MYLFGFLVVYFFLVFFLRSYVLWKKTSINPITFDNVDDAHGYNGMVFKALSVIELIVVFIFAFKYDWYEYLLPFWYLEHSLLVCVGWTFLIFSLIVVWIAQTHMANSWRIGIDKNNKTELVSTGLFSISRNPIFLGIMIANFGLFLVLPNSITLLIFFLSLVSINTQIRLEESYLESELGQEYLDYSNRVSRWL